MYAVNALFGTRTVERTGASHANYGYQAVAMEKAMRWAILHAEGICRTYVHLA